MELAELVLVAVAGTAAEAAEEHVVAARLKPAADAAVVEVGQSAA